MRQLKITKQITLRDNFSFNKYLQEVSQIDKPLSAEDEKVLAKKVKEGDEKAKDELITRNLRFVISVAKQYQNFNSTLEDLVSEGNYGLVKAAMKFDPSMGYKFISYAVWWIRQSIVQYLNDNSRSIRIPMNKIANVNKIRKIQSLLEHKFEREPSEEEILKECGEKIKLEDITISKNLDNNISSLDYCMTGNKNNDSDSFSLIDILKNENSPMPDKKTKTEDLKIEINQALKKIPKRSQDIIIMYFGLNGNGNKTLDEIGQELDLTRERVRQLKEKSITVLRRTLKKSILIDIF